MTLYGIIIAALAAVILFLNFGVTITAFCAAAIIILVVIAAVTGYAGRGRVV
jgi:hypothetical protein